MSRVQILTWSLDIFNFSVLATAFQNEIFCKPFPEETWCEIFLTSRNITSNLC